MVYDDIKARIPLEQYVSRTEKLEKSGKHLRCKCPFHNEDTPSFVIDPAKGRWHCFGACSESGDLFDFAMKKNGWSMHDALEAFAKELKIDLPKNGQADTLAAHYQVMSTLADYFHSVLTQKAKHAMSYLHERSISSETIKDYSIGFSPNNTLKSLVSKYKFDAKVVQSLNLASENGYELLSNRLVIPIRDQRGRVCAFAGRSMDGRDPKYINTGESPIFHKSMTLFNLDRAQYEARKRSSMIVVEGYMDVLQSVQAGFSNTVAQMGTALTEQQFKALHFVEQIIIATDGDSAGMASARRSAESGIRIGMDVRIALMGEGEDPDSMLRKDVAAYRHAIAKPALAEDFLIQIILKDVTDETSIQERESKARDFMTLVSQNKNEIQQAWHVQRLALGLGIPEQPLIDLLNKTKRKAAPPAANGKTPANQDGEAVFVYGLAVKPMRLYDLNRIFDTWNIAPLTAQDFMQSQYRNLFRIILEALEQYDQDATEYIKAFSPIEIPAGSEIDLDLLVYHAKLIRLRQIDEGIDLAQGNITALIQQKARILAKT